ncbi:Protein of unknown function DUF2237 [Nannochloropsis gaditana]|uniref:DUF2237 domain-containing protein n=1 Tax=Nannochloropsis gaditana TaxID=72520 RepID=W7T589_9STRA|nr:Protein of unknown function DUF2237 [Nannochloropsis gaditana]
MRPCARKADIKSFTTIASLFLLSSLSTRSAYGFLALRQASASFNVCVAGATPSGKADEKPTPPQGQSAFVRSLFTDVAERRDKEQASIKAEAKAAAAQRLEAAKMRGEINVLGGPLELCGTDPMTGFTREGCCTTGPMDLGSHTVCAVVSDDFLRYSKARGNDLMTPRPEYSFPGLKPGDRWCLCASRWAEAYDEGVACAVDLKATHIKALDVCNLNALIEHALEPPPSQEGEGAGGGEGDEKEQSGAQKASAGKKEDL